jgi:hypothetical protein
MSLGVSEGSVYPLAASAHHAPGIVGVVAIAAAVVLLIVIARRRGLRELVGVSARGARIILGTLSSHEVASLGAWDIRGMQPRD